MKWLDGDSARRRLVSTRHRFDHCILTRVPLDLPLSQLSRLALPALYTLFFWWFSTGLILHLDGLPARTFRWSLLGATALGVLSLVGLWESRTDPSVFGAYLAFSCSLLVWGWNEIAFLMGYLTGPRRSACPPDCRGWPHFRHAVEALLYHELALLLSALLIVTVTWGGPNQIGTWTFMVLWGMRISTKLNVFLGVPNLTVEFLPEGLRYLQSFFSKKPMNGLFPFSITISTTITLLLLQSAVAAETGPTGAAGLGFLTTLMALAVLEHWLLVVPLPAASLWSWGLRSRQGREEPERVDPASARVAPRPEEARLR
ncbi:MAG: putative photosynthetic complex assembly protein PuhE [bacterium]